MRIVAQRVDSAFVETGGRKTGEIQKGLLVYIGVGKEDIEKDADLMAEKIAHLRIFEDREGKMNLSLGETGGSVLVVSEFTLYGDIKKGNRPGFDGAAPPDKAEALYNRFIEKLKSRGLRTETGIFRTMMKVTSINSGPVTILCDSR